ncbi:MAG TPA: DUF3772 domain-containing protein [Caulobacteraceae bacterium]|nr:DUF3772 domain-containing protein [Caulobacteraceae bacterium]
MDWASAAAPNKGRPRLRKTSRRAVRLPALVLIWFALAAATPVRNPDADIQGVLAQATADLRAAGAGFRTDEMSDGEIKTRLAAIVPVESRLAAALTDLAPRLQDAETRLAQLGPAPAPPRSEDQHTAALRRQLERTVQIFQADEREAKLLSLEGQQISGGLDERLRENFGARLSAQSRSFLDPALWRSFALSAPADFGRVAEFVSDEVEAFVRHLGDARDLVVGGIALGLALLLLGPVRILAIRLAFRRAARRGEGSRLTRALLALWRVLIGVATPVMAGLVLHAGLVEMDALTDTADDVADLVVRALGFGAFIDALGRALLAPCRSKWRLPPIPDAMADRLGPYPGLIGAAAALAAFVAGFDAALGASVAAQVVSNYLVIGLEVAALASALVAMSRGRIETAGGKAAAPARAIWVLTALAGWAVVAVTIVALLFGYLGFAGFVVREAIWIACVFGLALMLVRLFDGLLPAVLAPKSHLGVALQTGLGLARGSVDQIAVLGSGLMRVAVVVFAWAAIAAPLGASPGEIFGRVASGRFVLKLGRAEISPGAIAAALALFFIGMGVTRAVRGWLEQRYLPKTHLDVGVRTSLAAAVTYLGALIAILTAFAYLGLSFSQIALFASALSVGIGFGLQSIIGNFVSGLILLVERPVRVGDWVAIGDQQGDVRKISIRATEIELFDRSRLIVPNTDLVTKPVRNVTHSGSVGRLGIVLKVSDDCDPAKVRDLILDRIRAHPDVLAEPAPNLFLTDASGGLLEFTAYAYTTTARQVTQTKSDLLFQLIPELKARGFALAANTTVINVAGGAAGAPAPEPRDKV